MGYTDIGEEIEWVNEDARQEEKKNKAKKGAAGGKKRVMRDEEPVSGAKERMQKMFQTAALKAKVPASTKAAPKINVAETDALLDDILGELDSPSTSISARTYVFGFLSCVCVKICTSIEFVYIYVDLHLPFEVHTCHRESLEAPCEWQIKCQSLECNQRVEIRWRICLSKLPGMIVLDGCALQHLLPMVRKSQQRLRILL